MQVPILMTYENEPHDSGENVRVGAHTKIVVTVVPNLTRMVKVVRD